MATWGPLVDRRASGAWVSEARAYPAPRIVSINPSSRRTPEALFNSRMAGHPVAAGLGCRDTARVPPTRRAFRSAAAARVTFLLLAQEKSNPKRMACRARARSVVLDTIFWRSRGSEAWRSSDMRFCYTATRRGGEDLKHCVALLSFGHVSFENKNSLAMLKDRDGDSQSRSNRQSHCACSHMLPIA